MPMIAAAPVPPWVFLLFPIAFVAMWCGICWLLSRLGGWNRLAARFAAQAPPRGKRFSMQSARIGWVNYNGCLTIHASPDGLHVAIWPLWRLGHPPLFVPWEEFHNARPRRFLWWKYVECEVLTPGPVKLQLSQKAFAAHPNPARQLQK
jgi:hypothetical protein